MAEEQQKYLLVLRASYDYEPQADAEDEIAIKENQLLFLLERTDDDWWKVKVKLESQDEEGPLGLVPSAYVEPAEPIQVVKVLYDYEATQPTELSVKEDEVLHVYDKEEEWYLVQSPSEEGRVGYVPGNYVEETDEEGSATAPAVPATTISSIVVPDSPPQPARPVSTYVDPADRVAAASNKAQADSIQTWAISEVDAKGKKKKGTLGIGNGAMFFASESDKNPVRKWQMSDIRSAKVEKSKHVHIDVGGAGAASLHFHAGSKDTAEAIMTKLESSRALANGSPNDAPSSPPPAEEAPIERPRSSAQKSVHFSQEESVVIPSTDTYPDEDDGEEETHAPPSEDYTHASDDGPAAVVLYDFSADGEDELTVHEGETLVVLERDNDEWWKCRNASGTEGVVPASYVEFVGGATVPPLASNKAAEEAAAKAAAERAAREEAERQEAERERAEKERKKREAEQRAKAAAAAAEADKKRREQEREKQKEREREEEARRKKQAEQQRASQRKSSEQSRSSSDSRRGPPPESLREWRDRTGQFRVDAAFLGFTNGKLRLHKVNGVVIEVPAEKMSEDDLRYVQKLTKQKHQSSHRRSDDDDEPLEMRRRSLVPDTSDRPSPKPSPQKKGPTIDWFEFFLNAGCDVDDCTRYASAFERDKIDEAILPDITEGTMRSLGLREGDIIRVKKAIEQRKPQTADPKEEQLRKDEALARQLQAEENGSNLKTRSPAPNLFAGQNGELKNMRRGRPQPSKSLPPANVDLQSISTASDVIQRTGSPMIASPEAIQQSSSSPAQLPSKAPTAAPTVSGFDDDAWTNRPSSTKPTAPTPPALAPRAPSAPPAPPAPPAPVAAAAPAPPTVAVSPPPVRAASAAPTATIQETSANPAKGPENDIFDQLARIAAIRVNSPAAPQPTQPAMVPPRAPSTTLTPTTSLSPPAGFQSGMGMGSSPVPMGQALQAQQTGMFLPANNGPRGPFAPVPANQALLQPLVPTTTGFSGFVPTRPATSPFQPTPPPQPQPTLLPQQTGFVGQTPSIMPQQTGFPPQAPMMSQPTGMPGGGFGGMGGGGAMGSFQSTPSFGSMPMNSSGFNPVQSNPTGFNPGFAQSPFGTTTSPPPQPQQQPVNTNPANIFASMKSGTFAQEDSVPQSADKYDALRPNPMPMVAQPTGWGGFGATNTYQNGGYGYQ